MGAAERARDGDAIVKSLMNVPPSMREVALNVTHAREANAAVDDEFADLYASAKEFCPKSIEALEDPRSYAAACLLMMQHETKSRSKRDILFHIGKIFGHDKRTIDIHDKRSYQDVIKQLQAEFSAGPVVNGSATVKVLEPDAGR